MITYIQLYTHYVFYLTTEKAIKLEQIIESFWLITILFKFMFKATTSICNEVCLCHFHLFCVTILSCSDIVKGYKPLTYTSLKVSKLKSRLSLVMFGTKLIPYVTTSTLCTIRWYFIRCMVLLRYSVTLLWRLILYLIKAVVLRLLHFGHCPYLGGDSTVVQTL